MKVKDKVIELATFLAYKDGWIVNEDFDFSSKLGSANTESYKVCRRADRFWAMALEVWAIVTGAPPDLEADYDDDIIEYELPTPEAAADLANSLLNGFGFPHLASLSSTGFASAVEGLSQSEISLAVRDAVKEAVMAGSESVSYFGLVEHLKARKSLLGG